MPVGMISSFAAISAAALAGSAAGFFKLMPKNPRAGGLLSAGLALGALGAGAFAAYCALARAAFSYSGSRRLSAQIISGVAGYVDIPEGGSCLDVGCGSGALSIACAKKNPNCYVIGIDTWGAEYTEFTKKRCEENAAIEGCANARFEAGNAKSLDFDDEVFDAVTSNYVYHNIMGSNKQSLLRETLRVLKKGGVFAIHDLMSHARYGDMQKFARELEAEGYEDVRLIDTTELFFKSPLEAKVLMLGSSRLLTGRK